MSPERDSQPPESLRYRGYAFRASDYLLLHLRDDFSCAAAITLSCVLIIGEHDKRRPFGTTFEGGCLFARPNKTQAFGAELFPVCRRRAGENDLVASICRNSSSNLHSRWTFNNLGGWAFTLWDQDFAPRSGLAR